MRKIERKEINNMRFYLDTQTQLSFPSVSTILNKMKDNKHLEKWKKDLALKTLTEQEKKLPDEEKEKVIKIRGEIEAQKIQKMSQNRGTKIHNQIEENVLNPNNKVLLEKKQLDSFLSDYISPVLYDGKPLVETPVLWTDNRIGFGGTFDFYALFKKDLKDYKTDKKIQLNKALIDWKNPLNVKYAESWSKSSGKYYPLTPYFLQCAAYAGALNQMVEKEYKVNTLMVVLNPQKSKNTIYLYYCDSYKTNFYWKKFKELLDCYFENKTFDWEKLNKDIDSKDVIPTRVVL